jgi:hypothetical protein
MTGVTAQTIAGYLERIGWWKQDRKDGALLTVYGCRIPYYSYPVLLEIRAGQYWVSIRAFVQPAVGPAVRGAVLEFLATLNAQCRRVRYFLVDDYVLLQMDVPAVQCHYEAFVDALRTVCRYTTVAGLEVLVLATNRSVADLYLEVVRSSLPRVGLVQAAEDDPAAQFQITANRLTD